MNKDTYSLLESLMSSIAKKSFARYNANRIVNIRKVEVFICKNKTVS